ncbi:MULTISPECIES: CPBP family intramembrane glutamic endopeptidase [unclassified Nocardiopsis]|uniref:CPBP family intramembrane glutamic endopeptidase n=1 Tax=unclassified Nocardiopsis TaxID=2649073 RepID=UPI001358DE37|nr:MULTISPECIES: CPBP family intramembrane glutamic endopeptidase [unclassified Nocardiopsis]
MNLAHTNATTGRARPHLLVRVAVVMAATLLVWQVMGWISDRLPEGPQAGLRHWVNALTVFVLAVPVVWLARRYLDRRPWSGLLLAGRGWAPPFLVGAASWLVPGLLGLTAVLLSGAVEAVPNRPAAEAAAVVAALVVLVLLFEAVPEELIFRGYLFRNLNTALPGWLTVLAQAALFTLFGLALWIPSAGWGVLPERLPLFFGMGVVLGCLRLVTGNVWACVGFHVAFQTVAQALLTGYLFTIGGEEGLMMLAVFASPFVFAVPVAMLLTRDTGTGRWSGRVPDPARTS